MYDGLNISIDTIDKQLVMWRKRLDRAVENCDWADAQKAEGAISALEVVYGILVRLLESR